MSVGTDLHPSAAAAGPATTASAAPAAARRLLVLSYEFPPIGGGGSRVAAGLAGQLAADGWAIDLVTMAFRGLPARAEVAGAKLRRVPCWRRHEHHCTLPEACSYALTALPAVRRLIRYRPPDLIHAHFIFPDGLIAWLATRGRGIPYAITAHGSDVPGYNPHRLKLAHRVLAPLWRMVVQGAAVVVCPSEHLRSLVEAAAAGARVIVIPNGFDPDRFAPRPKERRILVVTRMLERKGVQHLLAALDGLPPDYRLDIVGDGPYLPTLKALAARAPLPTRFWGWLDNDSSELKELYERAGIYVLPSAQENFPIGLLEAMAARTAIITTRGTGCEEVVGDAAWLVEPHDVAAIRVALATLTRDPDRCRRYGERALQRLETHFSWAAVAQRYSAAYRQYATG